MKPKQTKRPQELIRVPSEYWGALKNRRIDDLCKHALAKVHLTGGVQISFLHKQLLVDLEDECLRELFQDSWKKIGYPLLELLVLVYLLNVTPDYPVHEMISVRDLKDAHFFQGPHELKTRSILEMYGNNIRGFQRAAESLGGKALEMADAAYELFPFPKIPLYYLLWLGDEQFEANLSILFDRSIERHLSADAIWGIVKLVSDFLAKGE